MALSCERKFNVQRFRWMVACRSKDGIKENFIQIAKNINGLKVFLAEEAAQFPCDLIPEGYR